MPQMNPIWWTWLFFIFIITILLTNSMNYFYTPNKLQKKNNKEIYSKLLNWKW